jgi:carbonic anhydrase
MLPCRALFSWLIVIALLAAGPVVHASEAPAAAGPAPAKAKPGAMVAPMEEADALQRLRERLAERLGATKGPGARHVVRVVNRPHVEPAEPVPVPPRRVRAVATPKAAAEGGVAHWGYSGDGGPKTWGAMRPEFAKCGNGTRQSPIDIRGGFVVDLEPVQFDYKASAFRVLDNGHTLQVNLDGGNSIVAQGQRYLLQQFHFHHPAEERIDGRGFDMSLHLVHRDEQGRLAVVALLLERSSAAQPVVQAVWNNLPLEQGEEIGTRAVVDLNHLLPADRGYYTYMGSLTTPPCTEGVLWMVMRQPVSVTPEQVALFARLYPMNARPVQQAAGRIIKQSN